MSSSRNRLISKSCSINLIWVSGNGAQPRREGKKKKNLRGAPPTRYIDVRSLGLSPATSATVTPLFLVAAGNTVNTRVADTGRMRRFYTNFNIEQVNADVYSRTRVIFFQWHPNTAIALPVAGEVLQDPTFIESMYNWDYSGQAFTVLADFVAPSVGLASSVTDNTNLAFYGEIPLRKNGFDPFIQWNAGASTGSNQIFVLYISDSAIAPFPILNIASRTTFDCD